MVFRMEKQKTASTPYVLIEEDRGYVKIEGRCFHENTAEFFYEIDTWFESYLKTDFKSLTFDCIMDYFNSSALKALSNIILCMDKYSCGKNNVFINWIVTEGNETVIEIGGDFKSDVKNLTFNLVIN